MNKESASLDWGVKKCPLLDRQCMEKQCAWWVEDDKMCAIKKIKVNK